MRLEIRGSTLFGFDGKGARAFAIEGDAPQLIAEREYKNTWFDALGLDVGGACAFVGEDHVAVATPTPSGQAEILLLDADLEIVSRVTTQARIEYWDLAVSPDGGVFAGHMYGDGVVTWDATSGKTIEEYEGHISSAAAFSPDGRYICALDSGQAGGEFYLLDLETEAGGDPRQMLPDPEAGQPLYDAGAHAVFSKDGALLAFTSVAWGARGVAVYEVASMSELWSLEYEMEDPETDLWDAQEVAFSPDGKTLVVGVEGQIRAFDARNGEPRTSIEVDREGVPPYFALDSERRRVWVSHEGAPYHYVWPEDW